MPNLRTWLSALKRRRGQLLTLLVATLATVCFLEVAARLWLGVIASPEQVTRYALYQDAPPAERRLVRHHYLNYALRPGYRRGMTAINSLGYRGEEFPREKPEGVFRIALLGGSSTYTERVSDNAKTFPSLLQRALIERYGHHAVHVVNAGVPGYNSWESLIHLAFRVMDLSPDLIVIYHGTNDLSARLVNPLAYRSDNSGLRKPFEMPAPSWLDHSCLLRIFRRKFGFAGQSSLEDVVNAKTALPFDWPWGCAKYLPANPPVFFARNLQSMIGIARAHGVPVVLATWAHSPHLGDYASRDDYQEGFRQNNEVVREVGTRMSVPVFDFARVMPQEKEFWADGAHVNERGAAKKAELFARFLDRSQLIPR